MVWWNHGTHSGWRAERGVSLVSLCGLQHVIAVARTFRTPFFFALGMAVSEMLTAPSSWVP